jgi:hypothetical protein
MRQRILLYSFALLIISLSCLLFVIPHATVRAYHPLADTPTPTLDPVKILNEANAVATQAAEVASKSDTATTTTNTVASGLNTSNSYTNW